MKSIIIFGLATVVSLGLSAQGANGDFKAESCPVLGAEADGATYGVGNLFDSRPETAWCPASPAEAWFAVEFGGPRNVNMFFIRNGYQRRTPKGNDLFSANARVRQLKITNDRGESLVLELEDRREEVQYFCSSSLAFTQGVTRLRFTVLSTYPGAKYQDLLLSELRMEYADTSEDEMVHGG